MSTANKLTYLNETKSKIKQAINIAGANLTNEPFRVYSTKLYQQYLDILKNGTNSLYASMPKVTGTGTELSLQNTAELPMILELGASESTQDTLLPSEYQQVEYIESSGTQYIDTGIYANENTKMTLKFVAKNAPDGFLLGARTDPSDSNQFGFYVGTRNVAYRFDGLGAMNRFWDTIHEEILYLKLSTTKIEEETNNVDENITYSGTFSGTLPLFLFCQNLNGTASSFASVKLFNFKIYDDNTLLRDFIPCYRKSDNEIGLYDLVNNVFYTNQGTGTFTKGEDVASPNPDYPQDINVVTGENSVKIQNKNLIEASTLNYQPSNYTFSNLTNNSYKIEVSTSGTWYTVPNYKITNIKPNTSYTIKIHIDDLNINEGKYTRILIDYLDEKNNIINIPNSRNYIDITTPGDYQKTITATTNTASFIVRFYVEYGASNVNAYIVYKNLQLEKGSTATSYVEHKEQTYTLSFGTLELAKIGDYEDKIFNNIPSNPLYDNTLVEGGWYKYKAIGKYILDGIEEWFFSSIPGTIETTRFGVNNIINAFNFLGISDKFINRTSSMSAGDYECVLISNNGIFISIKTSRLTEKSLPAFKNWLSTNNVTLYYALGTPTTEQITDTTLISQLEDIKNAVSYDDETNISQTNANRPFVISASAIKNSME